VYELELVILVGKVIWLVVYAANLMKRQPDAAVSGSKSADASADDDELRQQTRKAIAKKNEEVAELHRRLQAEEEKSAAIGLELERMKLERSRLEDKLATLREENARLQQAPAPAPQPAAHRSAPAYENTSAAEHAAIQPAPAPVYDTPAAEPRRERPVAEQPANARVLKVIYLGRANNRGIFVRADRRINPGNTIYRLDTNDGLVGTFHVVDEPEVVETAITAPMDYLANGCLGEDLNDTRGVTRIITESPGTAIFENGYWKVLRKSRIRYE
ncbi:MAG: hypothetical protein K2M87_07200, partial [Muribaculaceae bacterium]|nr:hypothetical protein [Muribaculaceae bacterium]